MIIKVCGMREPDNIRQVEALGPDWMGFIFYPKSPRCVSVVPAYLPTRCKRVGVFVNFNKDGILMFTAAYGLDILQLHGQESPSFIRDLRVLLPQVKLMKAFSIRTEEDIRQAEAYEGTCDYYLFDTKCESVGGSGRQFDWNLLQHYHGLTPFLLSGGIAPGTFTPPQHPQFAGIDLNSRFETAPAVKDVNLLKEFLQQFNNEK